MKSDDAKVVLDPQQILDEVRVISGAAYAAFNQFDDNGRDFTTAAISGAPEHLERAAQMLGFDLVGRKWPYDPRRNVIINNNVVTIFGNLRQLTDKAISPSVILALEKLFHTGQVVVVKLLDEDRIMGDFTLIMKKGESFANREKIEECAARTGKLIRCAKKKQS